ncbi:MAG TPA: electron transfer flavoprotein subunit beta/FixA family protein [Acidimicrobiia bacterium]|nr:electron transfer flavoprotein subunit beta/FixA family protein [Acidimicrobiia bacterium]
MRVLVCVKRVPAPGARIVIAPDGRSLDTAHLGFTMSPHEECAVEEAVQIVERERGHATVLTVGPEASEEQLRYAVSLGVGGAALVRTDGSDRDPQHTAVEIVQAVRRLEERDGIFDLILFGNESADAGGFQVGIRTARALGRPVVNGVKKLEFADGSLLARRPFDGGFEEYRLPLPAVVGVKEGLNLPRYPTLKGRLASKKVEVEIVEATGGKGGLRMLGFRPPREQVSETVILGHGPEAAPKVVEILAEIGVL